MWPPHLGCHLLWIWGVAPSVRGPFFPGLLHTPRRLCRSEPFGGTVSQRGHQGWVDAETPGVVLVVLHLVRQPGPSGNAGGIAGWGSPPHLRADRGGTRGAGSPVPGCLGVSEEQVGRVFRSCLPGPAGLSSREPWGLPGRGLGCLLGFGWRVSLALTVSSTKRACTPHQAASEGPSSLLGPPCLTASNLAAFSSCCPRRSERK